MVDPHMARRSVKKRVTKICNNFLLFSKIWPNSTFVVAYICEGALLRVCHSLLEVT